jgi:hypothetical protein
MTYLCILCNRGYDEKYFYERHQFVCKFMFKSKKEKQNKMESIDTKFTECQKDKLLTNLLYEIEKMKIDHKRDMENINKKLSILTKKQKIDLENWLNSSCNLSPEISWRVWIESIPILNCHLEMVFKSDLLTGIIQCFTDVIQHPNIKIIPFYAFVQKPNTIYSYDNREKTTKKWKMMNNEEIKKIIAILSDSFLKLFQKYTPTDINTWKENEMIYSQKIMGMESCIKRVNILKDHIYSLLKRDFVEYEFI